MQLLMSIKRGKRPGGGPIVYHYKKQKRIIIRYFLRIIPFMKMLVNCSILRNYTVFVFENPLMSRQFSQFFAKFPKE
jgi:hypothetical protein